jgi:hypothetical protein
MSNKRVEATQNFIVCLKTYQTNKKLNKSIAKLIEDIETQLSSLRDKYSTPYGTKVSKAVERKNSEMFDEAEKELYKKFHENPSVIEFIKKIDETCGETFKKFRTEILKKINTELAATKKNIIEKVESKEFLNKMLKNSENEKIFYKMNPSNYKNLSDDQCYFLFLLCDRLIRYAKLNG